MRGARPAFVEKPKEAAAGPSAPRGHFFPGAPSTGHPVEGQLRPPGWVPTEGSLGPRATLARSQLRPETRSFHATMQTRSLPSPQYA